MKPTGNHLVPTNSGSTAGELDDPELAAQIAEQIQDPNLAALIRQAETSRRCHQEKQACEHPTENPAELAAKPCQTPEQRAKRSSRLPNSRRPKTPTNKRQPVDKSQDASISETMEREYLDARAAGTIGFMARWLVQVTLPHRRTNTHSFSRKNGDLTLIVNGCDEMGVPYGHYPRLLLCWMTTEAVRTRSRRLALGDSLTGFMAALGLVPTGGRWGTITRLREHCQRLFSATIRWKWSGQGAWTQETIVPVRRAQLFWDPANPRQLTLGGDLCSFIELSTDFYDAITARPVPIDMRVLQRLAQARSPLAIDLYAWFTYRRSILERPLRLPWKFVAGQFGADYASLKDFRRSTIRWVRVIKEVAQWDDLAVDISRSALTLRPGLPHVLPAHLR